VNIGHELIITAIQEGKLTPLTEAGLTFSWLTSSGSGSDIIFAGEDRRVFQWMLEHWRRYHKVPSPENLSENFPAYESSKLNGDTMDELIDLAVRRVNEYLVADLIGRTIDLHDEGRIETAISLLRSESDRLSSSLRSRIYKAQSLGTDEFDVEELLSRKMEMGIPLGIDSVDKEFFGFQPGQLITFMGRQKSGKTTLLLNSALNAWREGYTVLFFSVEMDIDMLRQRLYCLGAHVSPSRMMRGTLMPAEKQKVRDFDAQLRSGETKFYISKKKSHITVDDIMEEIEFCDPNVIYIDGFGFMLDRNSGKTPSDWQANENLSNDLKALALEKSLALVVAAQVQEKQYHAKYGIEAKGIFGGTGLLRASDLVIGGDKTGEQHTISCVMSRYNYFDNVVLEIDWQNMTIFPYEGEYSFNDLEDRDI
jgi:archaellum biogenesis ATPase FlaH